MVAATYTSDLTDIFLFEVTTGITAYGGGGAGLGAGPDYAIEGTNAVDKQVSASEKGFMYDNGAAFTIGPNDHFFIWLVVGVYGLADTRDNRGIHVSIGDDASNFVKFHVNGSDTLPAGGIQPYAIRFANTTVANRRTLVGAPGTTPQFIGGGANVTGTARFANFAADAARIGTGYDVLNGTGADAEADFAGIASDDESTAEGVFQTADGGFKVQGKIRIGNSGTECEFLDSNTNLFLVNTLDSESLTDFTEFIVSDDLSIMTLTNVSFIALGTNNPGRLEMVTPLVTAQDETSYDNSPTTEGTFSGGTGHTVGDVITLDDGWTTVLVDAVTTTPFVVTQFTVTSTRGRSATAGTAMTQSTTTGTGTGFSLTPDTDNIVTTPTVACTGVGFIGFGETVLTASATMTTCRWVGADQVTAAGADMTGSTIEGYEGAADSASLIWDVATDPDGLLDNMIFTMGTAATHAIDFGTNVTSNITLRGIEFNGYGATDDSNDSTVRFLATSGSLTLSLIDCTVDGVAASSGNFSVDDAAGIAVTVVIAPVTLTVTVKDEAGAAVQNARVGIFDGATSLMNELTTAAGVATESYSGTVPVDVIVKVRKGSAAPKYIPIASGQTVSTSGLDVTITVKIDDNNAT